MTDLIVFKVGNNHYALNIENIQRIIQAIELTSIPNAHQLIDGMMSYEDSVMKVLNFRKLIGSISYDEELRELFNRLKQSHKDWVDELRESVEKSVEFTKILNPHHCELGRWLDSFNSYDSEVSVILKNLSNNHKHLHDLGKDILDLAKVDKQAAEETVNKELIQLFKNTIGAIDIFVNEFDKIANSLQKLLIYENDGKSFAVKVDSIEDIAHIEESTIMSCEDDNSVREFLELQGILDIDGVLINVIKTIKLPS